MNLATENSPMTAGAIVGAAGLCLAAFTSLSVDQIAALNAVAAIVAGFFLQKYHVDSK